MKKNLCFVVLVALMFVFSCNAFADVTYQNGTITVSQSEDGLHTIKLDGEETGYWVDSVYGSTSFKANLADGKHTISFTTVEGSPRSPETFWVGEKKEETTEPDETTKPSDPDQPAPVVTENPQEVPTETPNVPPVTVYDEVQNVQKITVLVEPTCTNEGKASDGAVLPALGHCYAVIGKTSSDLQYTCVRCGKNTTSGLYAKVTNRLGNIVKDEDGAIMEYKGYALKNNASLYTIEVKQPKGAALLYLESSIIAQLYREGYQQVSFLNGDVELTISVTKISKNWFAKSEAITGYIFQTEANPVGGTLVVISALTATEIIPASQFDGVTLNGNDITRNGIY